MQTPVQEQSAHHAADAVRHAGRGEQKLTQLAPVPLLVRHANAGQLRLRKHPSEAGNKTGTEQSACEQAVKRRTRGREKGALTRLPTVPVLSSAARMPLPGEVIFFAVAISSSLYLLSAALPHILAMAASLAVQEQLL